MAVLLPVSRYTRQIKQFVSNCPNIQWRRFLGRIDQNIEITIHGIAAMYD